MTENRRDSLRSRPTPRVRPGPRANAVLLYVVGRSIPRSDRHDLEALLDRFHASDELQARCVTVDTNARRYLTLHEVGSDQCYKSSTFIPAGTLLAAYSGSLERVRPGDEDELNHSMHQGRLEFGYDLCVDGTPRRGDSRPGRLQLFNHCCEPDNNAVSEEFECPDTGLIAFFLRSKVDIPPDVEIRFPYQEPTFKNGVQVYPPHRFWKQAAALPPIRRGWQLVECNCRGPSGHCPNNYGRHERIRDPPQPSPPPPPQPPPPGAKPLFA